MPFTIVAENCTGCTACEKRCPTRAISGDPKKAFLIEPTLCIDCGACGVICPDEAILDTYGNVTKVLKRQDRPIAIRSSISSAAMQQFLSRADPPALENVFPIF